MKTGGNNSRKRPHQSPRDKTPLSASLRQIGEHIQKRDFSEGLSKANQALAAPGMTEHKRSRVLALVADSEFKRGRFMEAAQIQLQAATKSVDHATLWLRPHIGYVRALLKAPQVDQAVVMARQAVALAEAKRADFDELVRGANFKAKNRIKVIVPELSPRVSVVAIRMGYLFLQEGEPEAAKEFFEKAIQSTKGGANRARQGLAQIALAKGEPGNAVEIATDAIRRGEYKAKTVSAWKTLIAARRRLGGWRIGDRLIEGLDTAPAGLRSRTILTIVRELRKNDMRQWREVAERWSTREGAHFPVVETEIRKMILSSAKAEPGNAADKREKAQKLLEMPGLSAKEWLTGAKELVRASLWEGRPVDINQLVATAVVAYGQDFAPRLRHSLALSCMMAKRHDLARPLLQANIQQLASDDRQWGKSVWALARMEGLLGDHATAAVLYRQFADEGSIAVKFRLQAQLLWCQELIAAGQAGPLQEAKTLMEATLANVEDPDVLMNFARQLQLGPMTLRDWSQELFSQGENLALRHFHAADHPSVALKILFKLARRQLYDFNRPAEAIHLWDSFDPAKKEWLWTAQNSYWEYMGLLFDAYARVESAQTAEVFAQSLLDDPATPPEGLAYVGIPYAQWLIQERRVQDAQNLFDRMIKAAPNHPLCANAYYWKALDAYGSGDLETIKRYVGCLRRAQGNRKGRLNEWDLDAKALLLLAGLDVDKVATQVDGYTPERLHFLHDAIIRELGLLP